MSRPLTLHVSALNEAEFTTYTSSIHDIVDCDPGRPSPQYDTLTVGVREVRAWLRGRYPSIALHVLDSILRLFCPDLRPVDVVSGGQLLAVLRLVSHVLGGKDVDPSLVFVQAHPDELASRSPSPLGKQPRVSSNTHAQVPQSLQPTPDPPPPPDHNPFFAAHPTNQPPAQPAVSPVSAPAVSTRPPPPSVPPKPNNPFLNRRGSQDVPPQSAPASTPMFPGLRPSASVSQDGKTPPLPPRKPPILPPPRHSSIGAPHAQPAREIPPVPALPTRSVSTNNPNVLIQQSLQATRIAQSLKKAEQRLEQERVMEVLKSSSAGAVNAGSVRRVRSRSPVKESTGWGPGPGPSSASTSSRSAQSASSAERPMSLHRRVPSLPPRRNLSPPASTAGTARSFEQVATAKLAPFKRGAFPSDPPPPPPARRFASQNNSPSRTPPRPLSELPPEPPPLHPDRKPSAAAPTDPDQPISSSNHSPRVIRSKSMHQPSTPPVPPPPRRKRPESVQLTPTSQAGDSPFANPAPPASSASSPSSLMLSRHLSLSTTRERQRELERELERERERERGREGRDRSRESAFTPDGAIGSLQKTFTSLQLRAQPALDAARFKAEGAFSRRGFVQHGAHGPRWMRREGEARLMDDVDGDADVDVGADEGADAGRVGRAGAGAKMKAKLAGEGGGLKEDGAGRGWSRGGEAGDDESSLDHDSGEDSERERARVEERARRWREGGVDVAVVDDGARARMVLQRDDLKWPAGDGWRPL
ncbi:hypothetical protein C2E23DRAFT_897195 [Lenzites betulinus]|nr:hypothetical protein C2E23DRAFT_897195 [Lenzites betulinus]